MNKYAWMILVSALTLPGLALAEDAGEESMLYHGLNQDRSSESEAEALYVEKCSMCHRQAGMGTFLLSRRLGPEMAVLEGRDNLTVDYVKFVARNGLGNMPRIPPGEVSDEQLEIIANYLAGGK